MNPQAATITLALALGAPAVAAAEPRRLETTMRIGFAHVDAPADCYYCSEVGAPGLEAALAYPLSAEVELRAQAWWYHRSLEERFGALGFGLGTRSRPWSARVSVGAQAVSYHNADGGEGDKQGLVVAGEGAVATGRAGRFTTELAVRVGWAFADGGASLTAVTYGVVW